VNLPARFPPLYPLTRCLGKMTCAVLCVRTPPPTCNLPDTSKGARGPSASQYGSTNQTTKKVRRLMRCVASCRFRNRGNNCIGTHDAHYAITGPYRIGNRHHDASIATMRNTVLCANQVPPRVCWQECTTTSTINIRFQKNCVGQRDVGPTRGFSASSEVGQGRGL
jgi:hypothetical protein